MKKIQTLLLLLIVALTFGSCSNDDPINDENNKPDYATDPDVVVLSYDKFIDENDVTINSSDTTLISVNKAFLAKNSINIRMDRDTIPLVVWRTMKTAPFVRKILKVEDKGEKLQLTTIHGDIASVFPDSDFDLDTELFVDMNKSRFTTRGNGIQDVNSDRYIDKDGDIHPAVYIMETQYMQLDENGEMLPVDENGAIIQGSRADANPQVEVFTAEDLFQSNANFKIIDFNRKFGDIKFKVDGYNGPELYAKNIHLRAQVGMRINVKTKWFKLKNFEAIAYGDFGGGAKLGFALNGEKKNEYKKDIIRIGHYTSVFWVGVVPIAVTTNVGVRLGTKLNFSAKCDFSTTVDFNAGYELGCAYDRSNGWHGVKKGWANSNVKPELNTNLELSADAAAGVYLYAELSLSGCGGPGVEFGPEASAKVSAGIKNGKIGATANVGVAVAGNVNAKLKFLGWTLASWKYQFTLWQGPKKDVVLF